jgi:hypothetical protein
LFIIIFNLLVRALEHGKTTGDCEAYIDDLAVILNSPYNLQEAGEIFERFEQATGAKLNYEKCFVLCPNNKFTPKGRWSEMKGKNYRGWMTKYLGVPISLKLDPLADWKEVLAKMGEAASRIKKFRLKGASKIRAVNTFIIPIMTYLGRFKIMNREVSKEM